jgi:hypothetical protein
MLLDSAHARTLSVKAGAGIPDTRDAQGHCLIKLMPYDADMLLVTRQVPATGSAGCRCATGSRGCRSAGMCRSMPGCAGVCRMCRVPGRINHQKHLVWMGFGVYVDEYFCQGSAIHNNLIQ